MTRVAVLGCVARKVCLGSMVARLLQVGAAGSVGSVALLFAVGFAGAFVVEAVGGKLRRAWAIIM